jgi:hypothetical protein
MTATAEIKPMTVLEIARQIPRFELGDRCRPCRAPEGAGGGIGIICMLVSIGQTASKNLRRLTKHP